MDWRARGKKMGRNLGIGVMVNLKNGVASPGVGLLEFLFFLE